MTAAPDPVPDSPGAPAAPTRRPRLVWVTLGVALIVIIIDQITKAWAIASLRGQPPIEVVGQWLRLVYVENTGAAFSLGTGFTIVFSVIAVVVAAVIIRTARKLGSVGWAIALGGLLGGALGNLCDRVLRSPGELRGHVVDFIQFPHYPLFNVADSVVVCSAIAIAVLSMRNIEP